MSRKAFIPLVTLVFFIASSIGATAADSLYGAAAAKSDSSLTTEKMLTYALEQEYLIRAQADKAAADFQSKGERLFARIRFSAGKRIDTLTAVAKKYDVTVADQSSKHVKRCGTADEAFVVLKGIKKDSLLMYQQFLTKKLPDDVKSVFSQIMERATLRPPEKDRKDTGSADKDKIS